MTATDELRVLLDERGVEWGNVRNDGSESDYLTEWQFENNQGKAIAIEWAVGSGLSVDIQRYQLTPAQAIDATLGPGTCEYKPMWDTSDPLAEEYLGMWYTGCGEALIWNVDNDGCYEPPAYCPYCGGKTVKR